MTPHSKQRDAAGSDEPGAPETEAATFRASAAPVYETLRGEILRGLRKPGSHLVEAQIAQLHGVSRTPVRAAIARLEGDGLIETIPNRGAFVSRWTDTDFEEIYGLRVRLEPYATRLAAGKMDGAELDRLDGIAVDMVELLDAGKDGWIERCTELNAELHAAILQGSGSQRLISIVTALTELPLVRRAISLYPREMLRRNFEQHIQILQALRQGDGEWAESLMAAHILGARQALRRRQNDNA
jgi:DNA-binding GntR family transcriptional regulator